MSVPGSIPSGAGHGCTCWVGERGASTSRAAGPDVVGSVEQIHVTSADPADPRVSVESGDSFRAFGVVDGQGALVLRGIPARTGYRVTVGDAPGSRSVHEVDVLAPDDHPASQFYTAQRLDPVGAGYLMTRDGTLLSYRVILPDPCAYEPPYNLVIEYSGYKPGIAPTPANRDAFAEWELRIPRRFSELGYAVAGVNMRGSGCSGGAFDVMERLVWLDGYDMIEAFAAQEWIAGIALVGASFAGLSQLFVASTQPPSLDAIVPGAVVGDLYRDVAYPGGIPNVGFPINWAEWRDAKYSLLGAEASRFDPAIVARVAGDEMCAANQALRSQSRCTGGAWETKTHYSDSDELNEHSGGYWLERTAPVERIQVPTLLVDSWQDGQTGGRPALLLEQFGDATPVRLVATNGEHAAYTRGQIWDEVARFLDVHLGDSSPRKIEAYQADDPVTIFLETDAAGIARTRMTLPSLQAAGEGQRFVLGEELRADRRSRPESTRSVFSYGPPILPHWPPRYHWLQERQDCVTFTSEPLADEVILAGPGSVDLLIAVDDTFDPDEDELDLQATLSELRPDQAELLVQGGWLRASQRALDDARSTDLRPWHSHDDVETVPIGEPFGVRVELFPLAHAFRRGSQIRLAVSGPGGAANAWPWRLVPMPDRAGPQPEFRVTVFHGGGRESALVLPVVYADRLELEPTLPACGSVWAQPCRPVERPPARRGDSVPVGMNDAKCAQRVSVPSWSSPRCCA